jgi:pimeloyl-ACP methyl ester carboxylesterase
MIQSNEQNYFYSGGKAHQPNRTTLVFIHGAQHDHSVWILQSRYFAHHGYNVVAVDLPGHGRSTSALCNTVESMAQEVLKQLDRIGVEQFIPIGHSMGSLIALELSAIAAKRIPSLCLVGTSAPMKVSDALLNLIRNDEAAAMVQINAWSNSTIAQHPGNPGPGFSTYIQNLRLMQRQNRGVLLNDFVACNAYEMGPDRAAQFDKPCLIVQGSSDAMTPLKAAIKLQQAFPKPAQLIAIEKAGHAVMAERPDAVLHAIKNWLDIAK